MIQLVKYGKTLQRKDEIILDVRSGICYHFAFGRVDINGAEKNET